MKLLLLLACTLFASSMSAQDDCVTNLRGEKVCKNGQTGAAVNPNTGNAAVAQTNQNGVKTTQTTKMEWVCPNAPMARTALRARTIRAVQRKSKPLANRQSAVS
jgi:hypothetical protein